MKEIWFDDGLLSTYTTAFPVLKERDLIGHIALVTGLVGGEFYSRIRKTTQPCMNVDQLRELVDADWEIASHTVTHPFLFNRLSLEETRWELTESKQWIEENLGVTPTKFVVPRHLIRKKQMALAKEVYSYVRPIAPGNTPYPPWLLVYHWVEGPNWLRRRLDRGES